jgi:type IV pilus assembly protein PilO
VILLNNLSKREKLLVIGGGTLVLFYLYFNFFLKPIDQKIKIVNQSISEKTVEYDSIEKLKVSNISNAKKLEEVKKKYNEALKVLPQNERNPEISYSINIFAVKNNIKLISVAFGQSVEHLAKSSENNSKTPAETPTETPIKNDKTNAVDSSIPSTNKKLMFAPVTVVISGDYLSTLSFISNMEDDSRLAQIVNISMSSTQEVSNALQSTIVLNYYFTEGATKNQPTYDFKDDKAGKHNLFN